MSEKTEKLLCYNRGCGQLFDPSNNTEESCIHHPGVPVFHDAYKKWSCCEKKTTDFTEFLNIKGCTKSYHSNVKPPEPPKKTEDSEKSNKNEVYTYTPPQPLNSKSNIERPDPNMPMRRLTTTISSSLKPELQKLKEVMQNDLIEENMANVSLNTPCKNGGCKEVYKGEHSSEGTCIHHPGVPIFHEGMKYWSCCAKKTTDFESFMEQVGCTAGTHLWHKKKNPKNKANCRYDWHQTSNTVVISVYSKYPLPDLSYIEANAGKLHLYIVFGSEKNVFNTEILLFGVIDVEACSATFLGSKVEITLKKAEPFSWKELAIRTEQKTVIEDTIDEQISDIQKV